MTKNTTEMPEYKVWANIKRNCYSSTETTYTKRNIKLCREWLDFEQFFKDMGSKPTTNSKLIRIDTKEDYKPTNCKWSEDNGIRVDNKLVLYNDKLIPFKDLCEKHDINYNTAYSRLRRGWDIDDVFNTKPDKTNKALRKYEKNYMLYYQ